MSFCTKCGAPLAPGAQFCSKCGTAVRDMTPPPPPPPAPVAHPAQAAAVPPAPHVPPQARKRSVGTWWIVPLVIVGLVIVAWLLLAGLPFDREERRVDSRPAVDTIGEGAAAPATPQQTGTLIDLGDTAGTAIQTQTIPPPVQTTATAPATTTTTVVVPPPVVVEERRPPPQQSPSPSRPAPQPPAEQPPAEPREAEISEGEAAGTLHSYVTSRDYYDGVRDNCVEVRGHGYQNVGYTFSVWDACVSGGGSRMLGRWRVDARTREVFRQRDDGRYLPP